MSNHQTVDTTPPTTPPMTPPGSRRQINDTAAHERLDELDTRISQLEPKIGPKSSSFARYKVQFIVFGILACIGASFAFGYVVAPKGQVVQGAAEGSKDSGVVAPAVSSARKVASCKDKRKNGDETDVDCGGSCKWCSVGSSCLVDDDCQQQAECFDGFCAPVNGRKKPKIKRTGRKVKYATNFVVVDTGDKIDFTEDDERNIQANKHRLIGVISGSDDEIEEDLDDEVIAEAKKALKIVNDEAADDGDHTTSGDVQEGTLSNRHRDTLGKRFQTQVVQGSTPGYWTRVTATTSSPWNKVGRLSMGCTATYVGKRVLVTAAHCLYNKVTRQWKSASSTHFCPGQYSSTYKPYGCWWTQKFLVSWDWVNTASPSAWTPWYDWGIVILPASTSRPNLGYFGFGYKSSTSWNNKEFTLHLAGYPASKNEQMWYDYCKPYSSVTTNSFKHQCDTEGGNSGSAVYYKTSSGSRVVIGNHAGGSSSYNSGYKFGTAHYNRLLSYRSSYP